MSHYDNGNNHYERMGDLEYGEEADGIDMVRVSLAVCRSNLLDALAKLTTKSNRAEVQELLDALPTDVSALASKMLSTLQEERANV